MSSNRERFSERRARLANSRIYYTASSPIVKTVNTVKPAATLQDDGLTGRNFEIMLGIKNNSNPAADICINGVWYELKTRDNNAVSPVSLFSIEHSALAKMTESEFEQRVKEKLPNMIMAHYNRVKNEIRYNSIVKMTNFDYSKFVELFDKNIIYREYRERVISFRIRNHNLKFISELYKMSEIIELSELIGG